MSSLLTAQASLNSDQLARFDIKLLFGNDNPLVMVIPAQRLPLRFIPGFSFFKWQYL